MKKTSWIVLIAVALLALWVVKCYNKLVQQEEQVETEWAQVENQYQRRIDLIPNLVATVKGYATHEQETLEGVIAARAKATQITIDPSNAQGELGQALGRLMAVAESYPELKANENFLKLQEQLEGTENRITIARQTFNDAAKQYNLQVRRFPGNIIAMIFGFEKKAYFEAEEGANKAPTVQF